jgi:BolA protein
MSVEEQIHTLLQECFHPDSLIVRNDSHLHQGHQGSPGTGDTHFTVTIVSKDFENKSRVQCHQMVYLCLKDLMNNPIHALAIHTNANASPS